VAATIAGICVVAAERFIPHRSEWQPRGTDLVDDALFLALVQLLLPLALTWTVAWLAQSWILEQSARLAIWPNEWPIIAQLALKIVAGDFLRYWLHRAAHTWTPLWRLHAIHHAPEKLYTTNVFRFHPAEKALQFLCDTLPFMLVGIGTEVLAYYFVFYAVSGLLQHSNCDLKLGWLNYVVSGPEVHRWHHSRHVAESNNNFAHSFVVWDLLFGTYFRPRDRAVEDLGLRSRDYPRRFAEQLSAPFARGAP
jgi:sterol desaturase/sphingolipid hydroxylase (fatty acid hydroxylase superfamily)